MYNSVNTFFNHPPSFTLDYSWDSQNYSSILHFAKNNPGCVAVFDADGTLWSQDAEQAFFRWLFKQNKFVSTAYHSNSFDEYEVRAQVTGLEAYKWLLKALAGISESDLKEMSFHFMQDYFVDYIYPAQRKLVADLKKLDVDVWVVSASNQWLVQSGVIHLGIHPSHAIGIRLEVKNGLITDNILEPFPFREGKVSAIKQFIGEKPKLVFGDSGGDIPMLEDSDGLSVYIMHKQNQKDTGLELAQQKNWLVQYFPLTKPIQFHNKDEFRL